MNPENRPIEVNVGFGKQIGELICTTVDLKINFKDNERKKGLVGRFYNCLNSDVLGWYQNNTLYCISEFSSVEQVVDRYTKEFDKEIEISEPDDYTLSTNNRNDLGIIRNLLNKRFIEICASKDFIIDIPKHTVISSGLTQKSDEPPYIRENSFFEAFRYKFHTMPQGITLQMDPVLRVFERKQVMRESEFLLIYCERTDCSNYSDCINNLPNSLVKYLGEDVVDDYCPEYGKMERVYNPWTAKEIQVPKKSLFGRPNSRKHYESARTYALKKSEQRYLQTRKFFEKICIDNKLNLKLKGGEIEFSSAFLSIPLTDSSRSSAIPYSSHSRAGDVKLIFGPGMTAMNPYDGLNKFGTYSMNDPDPSHPNPSLRVFVIYPKRLDMLVTNFLERLKVGHHNYRGIGSDRKPFGTQIDCIKESISPRSNEVYSDAVKARLDNLRLDYTPREGDIYLIVLPENDDSYFSIKGFSVERNLKTQMIQERNLRNLYSSWYPLLGFALSLCVKAGIIPWKVDPTYFESADCYIGLAFSRQKRGNTYRFFVGVADVFDSFGEHLSFALHDGEVSSEIRGLHVDKEFMSSLVSKAIRRYNDKMGNSPERIVIHKPGSFLPDEHTGVGEALLEWDCDRALLVHIQHNSLFRAYNPILNYNPIATTYFRIGFGNAIVLPTGHLLSRNRYSGLGTPKPVQLNVKEIGASGIVEHTILPEELRFLIQNYLAFTRLRWSSLSSTIRDPITIYAPRVIAEWEGKGIEGLDGLSLNEVL
ncbi:MAG: hypothetical protein ACTSSE_13975 [Candidatus Thorarchaeota archaeon]